MNTINKLLKTTAIIKYSLILFALISSVNLSAQETFRVMSYNIRYDCQSSKTIECKPNEEPLSKRKIGINRIIKSSSPDMIGIQEIKSSEIEQIFDASILSQYSYYNYDPDSDPAIAYGATRLIMWKTDRFEKICGGWFHIEPQIVKSYKTSSWVVLKDKNTGNKQFVVNNHFKANAASEEYIDNNNRRIISANLVLDSIQALAQNLPVIMLGDFNATPSQDPIKIIKNGGFQYCDINHTPTYARDFSKLDKWKIDYIFLSNFLSYKNFHIDTTTLISGKYPSDHLPVIADIQHYIPFDDALYDPNGYSQNANSKYYFADVNGDGMADKIYWNYLNTHGGNHPQGTLKIYLANGSGTFNPAIYDPNGYSKNVNSKYYFADVNGDGKADKIYWNYLNTHIGNYPQGTLKIYLAKADGSGTFDPAIYDANGYSQSASTKYYFADVNGDGMADKIYWNYLNTHGGNYPQGTLKIYLAKADGSGTFDAAIYDPNGYSQSASTKYYFADVNGDGMADKIYWNYLNTHGGNYPQGTLKIYLAKTDGSGTFDPAIYDPNGYSQNANSKYYFEDLNCDGKADKIYWNYLNSHEENYKKGTSKIYYANGTGLFNSPVYDLRGYSSSRKTNFYYADINGDNLTDKIYWNYANSYNGNYPQGTLKLFLNKNPVCSPVADLACEELGDTKKGDLNFSEETFNVSIAPNPFENILKIDLSNLKAGTITLYGLQGKLMLQQDFDEHNNNIELETSKFNNGMYLINIQIEDKIFIRKLVK